MQGTVGDEPGAATNGTVGRVTASTAACGSNPHEWLYNTALDVFGKDAGHGLARLTGYPERSCYAYVAHDAATRRRPPGHFERAVVHRSQDRRFFDAFMQGCDQPWWLELQRHAALGRAVLDLTK